MELHLTLRKIVFIGIMFFCFTLVSLGLSISALTMAIRNKASVKLPERSTNRTKELDRLGLLSGSALEPSLYFSENDSLRTGLYLNDLNELSFSRDGVENIRFGDKTLKVDNVESLNASSFKMKLSDSDCITLSESNITFHKPFTIANGSISEPGLSIGTSGGIYSDSSNIYFTTNQTDISLQMSSTQLLAPNGSSTVPGYTFKSFTDTGFSADASTLYMIQGGSSKLEVSSSQVTINDSLQVNFAGNTTDPNIWFRHSSFLTKNGISLSNSEISFSIDGTQRAKFNSVGTLVVGDGVSSSNSSVSMEFVDNDRALVLPKLTTTQRNNISSPESGMTIYNTTLDVLQTYNGSTWAPDQLLDTTASPTFDSIRLGSGDLFSTFLETTTATTFSGPSASAQAATLTLQKIGNIVVLSITAVSVAFNSASTFSIGAGTLIPSDYRINLFKMLPISVTNNSTTVDGSIEIGTDGDITIGVGPSLGNFTAGTIGWNLISVYY